MFIIYKCFLFIYVDLIVVFVKILKAQWVFTWHATQVYSFHWYCVWILYEQYPYFQQYI